MLPKAFRKDFPLCDNFNDNSQTFLFSKLSEFKCFQSSCFLELQSPLGDSPNLAVWVLHLVAVAWVNIHSWSREELIDRDLFFASDAKRVALLEVQPSKPHYTSSTRYWPGEPGQGMLVKPSVPFSLPALLKPSPRKRLHYFSWLSKVQAGGQLSLGTLAERVEYALEASTHVHLPEGCKSAHSELLPSASGSQTCGWICWGRVSVAGGGCAHTFPVLCWALEQSSLSGLPIFPPCSWPWQDQLGRGCSHGWCQAVR